MKKALTFLLAFSFSIILFAQVPEKMSFQAVIRNANSKLLVNSEVTIKISIVQDSSDGNEVYSETHSALTNVNGLVSLEIGTGEVYQGDFSMIDWSENLYFIKTETDLDGGNDYSLVGTSQLLSVPYALHAKTVENYDETVTTLSQDTTTGAISFIDETGTQTDISLISNDTNNNLSIGSDGGVFSSLNTETVTTLTDNGDGTFSYQNEDNTTTTFSAVGTITDNENGTFTFINAAGISVTYSEIITTLSQDTTTGVISFIDETGTQTDISLISNDTNNNLSIGSDGGAILSSDKLKEKEPWKNQDMTPATNNSTNINYLNGNVGIGTDNPTSKLEVDGKIKTKSLQLGVTTGIVIGGTCTSTDVGKIVFNGSNFCTCDGTVWSQID